MRPRAKSSLRSPSRYSARVVTTSVPRPPWWYRPAESASSRRTTLAVASTRSAAPSSRPSGAFRPGSPLRPTAFTSLTPRASWARSSGVKTPGRTSGAGGLAGLAAGRVGRATDTARAPVPPSDRVTDNPVPGIPARRRIPLGPLDTLKPGRPKDSPAPRRDRLSRKPNPRLIDLRNATPNPRRRPMPAGYARGRRRAGQTPAPRAQKAAAAWGRVTAR